MGDAYIPYSGKDGIELAYPGGMNEQEQNNLVARVRTLEVVLNQLAMSHERDMRQMDARMQESHATWESGVNKIAVGIRETHENLYHPSHGAFVRLDRLEQLSQSHSKIKFWLVGFLTSAILLILGTMFGKFFGK